MSNENNPNAPTDTQRTLTLRLYKQFLEYRTEIPLVGHFMDYHWLKLPNPLSAAWMPYSLMFDEFASEIATSINNLTNHTHRLAAWNCTIDGLSNEEKLHAVHEFIDMTATIAVNLPHVIQSRFIFATGHLCHQANRAQMGKDWKDDFPMDRRIDSLKNIDKYGAPWSCYPDLKDRIASIYDEAFKAATHDFRNVYNHRFSPRFVIGITNVVQRIVRSDKRVSYAIGGLAPFQLDTIVPLLGSYAARCYDAFDAFKALVREHEATIAANNL